MDFLTQWFIAAGVAAASIPVVLHMLRRAPNQDMPFSVVKFLKPSQPKLTKRSSIEHWPLMLLRILAVLLIGLAFARPFLREVIPLDATDEVVQSVTLLVDKSASMRRDGIYEQVQKIVRETISQLSSHDQLSVVVYSNTSTKLLSREKWISATEDERAALVEGILEAYEPDWMATDTGAAMRIAADELAEESKERLNVDDRRLVLVTDFQRGSDLDELKSGNWPANVEVELKTVTATKKGNVGVAFVQDRRTDRTRVRVTSAGDTVQQEFELKTFDVSGAAVGQPIKVMVAPGQRRSLILPVPDSAVGKSVVGIELLGDDHPFDNVIDLPDVENPVVKVAHIGPSTFNDPESMRYYLQRVLDGNQERNVIVVDLVKDDGVVLPIPADVSFVVATDVVPAGLLDSIREFLDRSGTLLVAPPSVAAVESLKKFLPADFEVKEAVVDEYAMPGFVDFDHPLFSIFSDARFADFSSIKFWRHRNLIFSEEDRQKGDWSIVAKFDSGMPAIAEVNAGAGGRIILLAAGWQPTDSQFALSTRFPPLLTRILALASPAQKDQLVQTVGDIIRPESLVSSDDWSIQFPDGEIQTAASVLEKLQEISGGIEVPPSSQAATVMLSAPGRYKVTGKNDDGDYSVMLIAGLAASETQTEMLPVGQLQVLGIGVQSDSEEFPDDTSGVNEKVVKGQLTSSELERKQKWWRWLLLAGMGCLLAESLWAAAIERQRSPETA